MFLAASAKPATKSSWMPGRRSRGIAAVQSWPEFQYPNVAHARDDRVEVGVVEHDDRRLAAELEVHPLERVGRGFMTMLLPVPDLAGERDDAHLRMSDERGARVSPSPVMTLNTPGGKTSAMSSASRRTDSGVSSDGFKTRCCRRRAQARSSSPPS